MGAAQNVPVLGKAEYDPETTFESWLGLLDPRPRLVVNRDLEVLWESGKATELLIPPMPIRLAGGRLESVSDPIAAELRDFIGNVSKQCETLLLREQGERHWAMVMALSPHNAPDLVCIMLNLSVPHRSVEQSGLAQALSLTATEARVLDQYARSNTPREIADLLGVSLSTIRSHLKQIHCKAGVNSAVQLTQLVRGFCSC